VSGKKVPTQKWCRMKFFKVKELNYISDIVFLLDKLTLFLEKSCYRASSYFYQVDSLSEYIFYYKV